MNWKIIPTLPLLLLLSALDLGSAQLTPPTGCSSDLLSVYFNLCDLDAIWGVVLEALAVFGVLSTLILIIVLLAIIPFISDSRKRVCVPIQFIFLLGTMGIFGLTFAFIIKFDQTTCPTRIFLWGVLFAVCFSCLLAHVWRVLKLVRSGRGPTGWCMIGLALSLTLVQVIIAIEFLVLRSVRFSNVCFYDSIDFVMLLIYIMFLMALTFILSMFTFCGQYRKWKKHGLHVFITMFFSIAIWVVWIIMFVRGNVALNKSPQWDNPTLSIALVSNGLVFIIFYTIPELCQMTSPAKPEDEPNDRAAQNQQRIGIKGVDNQVFILEEPARDVRLTSGLYNPSTTDQAQLLSHAPPTRSLP
ncbi:G-protein coupled receptor family C group 5 member B-like isoform X2 [Heptranchias perlo]|uniref:G-protein coupled receptor family C group 5 member B-like isoform X2 n=1 Tax=Heptranchias perlo TaxID=212740 RepID=UPI00355950BB